MALAPANYAAFKTHINANTATIELTAGNPVQIKDIPNTPDNNAAIAAWYNALSADYVHRTDVPVAEAKGRIQWKKMTPGLSPTDATITTTEHRDQWRNRALMCQCLQFNLQNLLLEERTINAANPETRQGFQDALAAVPSTSDLTGTQDAGWGAAGGSGLRNLFSRLATRVESALGSGTGTQASPKTMTHVGDVSGDDVTNARNS